MNKNKNDQTASRLGKSLQRLPSAFELAMLATFNNGNLKEAFRSYILATEFLANEAKAELDLRRKMRGTIDEQIEAFGERVRSGDLKGEAGKESYEVLRGNAMPFLVDVKLFMDQRADSVKQAIRQLTGRSCGADTARDYLRAAWMRSQLPPKVEVDSRNMPRDRQQRAAAIKRWNQWCDEHRNKSDRSLVFSEALLNDTLKWIQANIRANLNRA